MVVVACDERIYSGTATTYLEYGVCLLLFCVQSDLPHPVSDLMQK